MYTVYTIIYSSVIHIHILYAFAGGPITDFTQMSILVVFPLDVSDMLQVLDSNSSRNEQEAGCLVELVC